MEPQIEQDQELTLDERPPVEYAGFWIRLLASVLDSILLLMIMVPLLLMFYGPSVLFATESPGLAYNIINYVFPILAVIIFWQYRAATPGKIMMGIYIVDADTLEQPTFGRLLLRYLGYYVSILPVLLGFIWVAFDKRKQGFHDKIANTVVIRRNGEPRKQKTVAKPQTEFETVGDEGSREDPWTA